MLKTKWVLLLLIIGCSSFRFFYQDKLSLYIIGDSTVKNGTGTGADKLWGWGSFIHESFDSLKISVRNHAIGGRSSRTFITDGRWTKVLDSLKKGDYVLIQFGHNDGSPLDDTARARGTIKGIGNDSVVVYNPIRKVNETVHTFGWYMKKMITEAQGKGAIAIVCSPVPRNNFQNGKVKRGEADYGLWAKEIALQTHAPFIDLNNKIADKYDALGQEAVNKFFPKDHTHPNEEGSRLNAEIVVESLKKLFPIFR